MPMFRSADQYPDWCELEHFEIVRLNAGDEHCFTRRGTVEKLIVGAGRCRLRVGADEIEAALGANIDLVGPSSFAVLKVEEEATLVRFCGRWGTKTGGSGVFNADNSPQPEDKGDPVSYEKWTNFDCHFHDCDEYWVILEGEARAVSEGKTYEMKPGDCLATGMGHHHDLPLVHAPVRGVYFETTLEGQKRRGHLWNHTHGLAEPQPERV